MDLGETGLSQLRAASRQRSRLQELEGAEGLLATGSKYSKPAEYYVQNEKSRPKINQCWLYQFWVISSDISAIAFNRYYIISGPNSIP